MRVAGVHCAVVIGVAGLHCAVVIGVAGVNTNSHAEVASTGLQ